MNRKIIADTRRHVMKWCACNDGTGFCRARDMPCVQITIFENHQEGEPLRFCRYSGKPFCRWTRSSNRKFEAASRTGWHIAKRAVGPSPKQATVSFIVRIVRHRSGGLQRPKTCESLGQTENRPRTWTFRHSETLIIQRFQNSKF